MRVDRGPRGIPLPPMPGPKTLGGVGARTWGFLSSADIQGSWDLQCIIDNLITPLKAKADTVIISAFSWRALTLPGNRSEEERKKPKSKTAHVKLKKVKNDLNSLHSECVNSNHMACSGFFYLWQFTVRPNSRLYVVMIHLRLRILGLLEVIPRREVCIWK